MCLQTKLSHLSKILSILLVLIVSPLTLAGVTRGADEIQNTAIYVEIGVDYNRDGQIEFPQKDNPFKPTFDRISPTNPYVFWINDDDDKHDSETSGNDTPGTRSSFWGIDWIGEYNYENNKIDGTRDLIDFFPIAINFHDFFNLIPDSENYTFRLKQADQAVNIVFTEMKVDQADDFLRNINVSGASNNLATIFGAWQETSALDKVPVHHIESEGVDLPSDFIDFIKANNNQGVLLVEGSKITDEPLLLEIIDTNNQVILTAKLPLKLVEVEDMYAIADIRGAAYKDKDGPNGYSAIEKADELRAKQLEIITNKTIPTSFNSNHTFVLLHGYKVTPEAARGWHAEVFKRLFQSGSNAMYVGFSWDSNGGSIDGLFNYWGNVESAFNVAETVSAVISQGLDGEITVAAHSLGNIVLGAAITQYGLRPQRYFMLDPATPLEAYDPSQLAVTTDNNGHNLMSHPDWHTFDNKEKAEALNLNPQRLWSADWHKLFDSSDNRSQLAWLGLFQTISSETELYQFYSSGEEVLAKSDGSQPGAWDSLPEFGWFGGKGTGQNAWIIQEKHKGTKSLADAYSDEEGGWGFNCKTPDKWWRPNLLCDTHNDTDIDTAYALTDDELRLRPFFKPFSVDELFSDNAGVASDAAVQYKDHMLAFALPALSHAAGVTKLTDIKFKGKTFDMMVMKDGWPEERGPRAEDQRWFHSDAKDVAYRYVYKLYDTWVEKGQLK